MINYYFGKNLLVNLESSSFERCKDRWNPLINKEDSSIVIPSLLFVISNIKKYLESEYHCQDWISVAKSWTAKIPPRCRKSQFFVPPLLLKMPQFLDKKSRILRNFFGKFDPSYNFYCIFMHKFFSNFKNLVNFF